MKNEVNRALVAKKDNFQSKSVPRGTRTIWRYLGALFILFTFAIGNVWAESVTFTATDMSGKTSGVKKESHITALCPTSESDQQAYKTGSAVKYKAISLGSSADTAVIVPASGKSLHFRADAGYKITGISIFAAANKDSICGEPIVMWTGAISKKPAFVGNIEAPSRAGTSDPDPIVVANIPDGTTAFALYRRIKYNSTTGEIGSGSNFGRSQQTWNIFSVTITYEATGSDPVCPETLTISSKDSKTAFDEGDAIELTAALAKGNGDISYQWYKDGTAEGNKLTGKNTNKLQIASCTTADEGSYYCVASKTSCDDAVNASAFAITVEADTKCFNMPEITSKPSDLAHVTVSGGTLSDVSTAKSVAMNANGLKLDGNSVYLKVSLASASIVEGTKITVAWKGASSGAGLALVNENLASKVINETNVASAGSVSHTFTAEEAANYADEFILHRNGSGQGIYVNAITVEDCGPAVVKHTITLNYNDGVTPNGSLKVVDGKAATQPTDPTRGKYTFLGWFVGDTDNAYVWSSIVNDDITLKAHWQNPWTISFDADGGSAVADITVKHNTKAEKPADPTKASHDFNGWYIGDTDNAFDWDANVTADYSLKAHWLELVAKYDIEYYDGGTKIGTEAQVRVDQHPTAAGISTDKPLYTFVGWYTSSTLEGDPVDLNTVTPSEGLKIYGKWAKAYANSVDFVKKITDDGTSGWAAYLEANNYYIASTEGVSFDNNNAFDTGLKMKTTIGNTLSFTAAAGKVIDLTVGNISGMTIAVNGGEASPLTSGTDATHLAVSHYYAAGEQEVVLTETVTGYNIIRQIAIRDPYQVSFDANDGDPVAAQYGYPSVTLPSASKGTDSFLGWFIGEDKIGEAGDSYTPTANVELVAHWEAVSTDARLSSITFSSDAGTLVPAWNMELTEYTYTMPYGTTAIPTVIAATANFTHDDYWYIESAATAWGETTIVRGKAVSGDTKAYNIKMEIAPKDGVCLIKGNVGNNTFVIDEEASLLSGTPSKSNVKSESSTYETLTGWKFNSRPAHLGLTLSEGTFQEGDVVEVFVTSEANGGGTTHKMRVFDAADATPAHVLAESAADMVQGANRLVLPATSTSSLYLHRGASGADYENWNPYVAYFAVYRPMNPMLTAMTIDGRTVTINEDAKTATVTIPYESDLANLTIAKTIVWNAPATENSIVVNGGSAWVIGENTYKLTDKDGDATTYTITVARDVLKHTVSFNTHGGSAVASVEVVDGESLAAAPADPTKEDYIFQGWAETDGGAIVDVTSFTISADKEFHAVWTSDGGIKLINKTSGAVNEDGYFITGVTATEANSEKAAAWGGTQGATISGTNQLGKIVQYNATTNQTKLQIKVYNTNNSDKYVYIHKIIEGNTTEETVETLTATSKTVVTSEYYEFNNTKNRSFYITTNSTDVKILQVKVIESGETPMKQAGEAGYSLNLNKGRALYYANSDVTLEGLALQSASNYNVISSTEFQTTKNFSFSISTPVLLKVTTNTAKYYVSQDPDEDGTTATAVTDAGTAEFNLTTTGTWYLVPSTTSNVKYTNIAFELPKAEKPVFGTMSDIDLCAGDAFTAIDGTATVSDGGVVSYKWYKEGSETVLGTAATYTPSADGNYYVVATNSLADHQDNSATSDVVTVKHFDAAAITTAPEDIATQAGQEKTLTIVASGANLHYVWYTCDDAEGTNPVAIVPAQTTASLTVTVPDGVQYYKVAVTDDCGADLSAVVKVEGWTNLPQVDVTESTVWDMTNVSANAINLKDDYNPSKQDVRLLLANIEGVNNNASFNSQALMFEGQHIGRTSNNVKHLAGRYLQFNVTKRGIVSVTFASNGSNQRTIRINDKKCANTTNDGTYITHTIFVQPGSVEIMGMEGESEKKYVRIKEVKFTVDETPDYERAVSNNIGTLCVEHNVMVGGALGATFYQIASRNADYDYKIDFEEVLPNEELKAGEPYIFQSNTGKIELFFSETTSEVAPIEVRGMIGNYAATTLAIDENNMSTIYYFAQNKLWTCENLVGSQLKLNEHRAYIDLSQVPTYAEYEAYKQQQQNSAPRRRVSLVMNGQQVATGIENGGLINGENGVQKVLINGKLFILRGEKMYDVTGKLVK